MQVTYKDCTSTQTLFVIRNLKTNLLGLPAIQALQIVQRLDAVEAQEQSIREQFPKLFTGLGNFGEDYDIQIKEGAVPHCVFTPRHVPFPMREKVQEQLDKMEAMDVISKVDGPTDWCAGMVAVPKKSGDTRICVILKALNNNVMHEVYPIPTVEETLGQVTGATVFSKLDANSGYWQIPLSESSKHLTTFVTPSGRYCFNHRRRNQGGHAPPPPPPPDFKISFRPPQISRPEINYNQHWLVAHHF